MNDSLAAVLLLFSFPSLSVCVRRVVLWCGVVCSCVVLRAKGNGSRRSCPGRCVALKGFRTLQYAVCCLDCMVRRGIPVQYVQLSSLEDPCMLLLLLLLLLCCR